MAWAKRSTGTVHKWEKGLTVEGNYLGFRSIMTQFGEGYLVEFELARPDGKPSGRKVTYGCPAVLKSALDGLGMDALVRVVCNGKGKTKGGQEMWLFDVYTNAPEVEDLPF
jgi:hypothetical protein